MWRFQRIRKNPIVFNVYFVTLLMNIKIIIILVVVVVVVIIIIKIYKIYKMILFRICNKLWIIMKKRMKTWKKKFQFNKITMMILKDKFKKKLRKKISKFKV